VIPPLLQRRHLREPSPLQCKHFRFSFIHQSRALDRIRGKWQCAMLPFETFKRRGLNFR
jgi:hypothetical protein